MYKKLLITSLALCIGFASCKQETPTSKRLPLSLIHIYEPTRTNRQSRIPK